MNWRNSNTRYGTLSIGLHWLMLLLIAAVYASMELHENFPKGSAMREGLKTWHFMLGLSVLALLLLRAALNLSGRLPRIRPEPPAWQTWLAKGMHLALYAWMLLMPLLGWLLLSAEGKPIALYGLHLPALVGPSERLADWVEEIHEAGASFGYVLIGLHAAAALFHHHVMKDDTLRRMLPQRD